MPAEVAEIRALREIQDTLRTLEKMVGELRHNIGYRRTMLKNAEKKLQEFQDTIYAMLMEEEAPRKKNAPVAEEPAEPQWP